GREARSAIVRDSRAIRAVRRVRACGRGSAEGSEHTARAARRSCRATRTRPFFHSRSESERLLTRYSRYDTCVNALTRCHSLASFRSTGRGPRGAARSRRVRPTGGELSARRVRRADRRLLRAAWSEARAGHLPQVRAAGTSAAQPPRGREGEASRLARALSHDRHPAHQRDQVADGRGHDPRGHPPLLRVLPRPAGRRRERAGRSLRRARQDHRREGQPPRLATPRAGASAQRRPAQGESIREGHGTHGFADHRTRRDRKGRPMSELKQNVTPDLQDPPEVERPRQRARTMSRKEMARQFRQQMAAGGVDPELQTLMAEIEATRPKSRGDCAAGPRPCPYVSCKFNLYVDVNPRTGSVKMNFPDKELWELADTCALDVADRGGITLEEVG